MVSCCLLQIVEESCRPHPSRGIDLVGPNGEIFCKDWFHQGAVIQLPVGMPTTLSHRGGRLAANQPCAPPGAPHSDSRKSRGELLPTEREDHAHRSQPAATPCLPVMEPAGGGSSRQVHGGPAGYVRIGTPRLYVHQPHRGAAILSDDVPDPLPAWSAAVPAKPQQHEEQVDEIEIERQSPEDGGLSPLCTTSGH